MKGSVRKLAFDFAFRWLLPLQILTALSADYFYLFDRQISGLITGGVMLALQGTSTYNKVGLWRTLPVTGQEIGLARWWQMTGLPGVAIVVIMAAALVLHTLVSMAGWPHLPLRADAEGVLRGLLLQFFYPVFLTVFSLATLFARSSRSPFAYAAIVAAWAPWLLLLPNLVPLPAQDRYLLLGLIGAGTAVILYVTAAHWPQPITQPVQIEVGRRDDQAGISTPAGRRGWLLLCGMALVRVAIVLIPIMAFYIAVIVALDQRRMVPMQMLMFIPFIVISQITQFNGTGLRLLRALPGSAFALTAYLFLLPLVLLAAITVFYSLILAPWLAGSVSQIDMPALAAVLFASALALPAALAVSQTAMSLILVAAMALVALIQYGWDYLPVPWNDARLLAGLTLLAIGAGLCWMHAQVSRGTQIYRYQPFAAPRWRGND